MTNQPEHTIDCTSGSTLEEFLMISESTLRESTKEKRTYHIEVNDDTHWALVSIAAKQKLHQEDFVEALLVEFIVEHRAATAANKTNS
jgi:hypothetical protein